jgi:hypothetical protein
LKGDCPGEASRRHGAVTCWDFVRYCCHFAAELPNTGTAPGLVKGGYDQAIGRSRGGLTTKIHVIVSTRWQSPGTEPHRGSAHDITQAEPWQPWSSPKSSFSPTRRYDADSFINSLEIRSIKAGIPAKLTRKVKRACDFALYAERSLVERFFNAIKHYRGMATRYSLPDYI